MKTPTKSPQIQLLPEPDRKASCSKSGSFTVLALLSLALLLGSSLTASAFVLDNFNGGSISGWTSVSNGGSVSQSGGQFTIAAAAVANSRTYSKKTSLAFSNVLTHTLEFRVLVNSVTDHGQAVLGWVPTGGALGTNGYALCVGVSNITIRANTTVLYTTNEFVRVFADGNVNDDTSLPSTDMYLAMRMTPSGADVVVKSTVYKKADGRTNLLFEITVTNSPGIIGTEGNASLGAFNDASGVATSVSFDDLHYFDTVRVLLDDFSGPYPGTSWTDYTPGGGATNLNDGAGHLKMVCPASPVTVSGTFKSDKVFKLNDGVRLEFRIDAVDLGLDPFDLSVMGYIPDGINDFSTLTEYYCAFSPGVIYLGTTLGHRYEDGTQSFPTPTSNVRALQFFTGEGSTVRIESRLEDLSKDVNDPTRVLYQRMRVETSDVYFGKNGNFALTRYRLGGAGADITLWDNAEANKVGGIEAPVIANQSPPDGKTFYDPMGRTAGVSFVTFGDTNIPLGNVSLTLNGVAYTNGSPGVTITPTTPTATSRSFSLTNLATNVFYSGTIQVVDVVGNIGSIHYEIDTFQTNSLQIEAEDFNYSINPGVVDGLGGQFIDGGLNAYALLQGTEGVDFHDTDTGPTAANPYRDQEPADISLTADPLRAQYVAASMSDYIVVDNNNNEWRNYTRTFAAGTYKVYSRQSTFTMPAGSLASLARVTSDAHTNGQTTSGLGVFRQLGNDAGDTGFDLHRDVLLTDATGNPAVVRLAAGVATVRLTDEYVNDSEDSDVFHNYLVFVPTPDPGTLRPIVTVTKPVAGDTFRQSPATEATFASIANRDTSVTNVVSLKINGVSVPFTNTDNGGGTNVNWSFASVPAAAALTNTLIYQDSGGVSITSSWTYSYPLLRATNRLVGGLPTRGFAYRMVQTDGATLGNSILRAEAQLAGGSYTIDRSWSTNVGTLDWDDNIGVPVYTPGLDGGISGYAIGPYDNIATESLGYMQLTAGAHRFRLTGCDDGLQVRSGTTPSDTSATILGFQNGTFNGNSFDFLVEADGLYPVRALWYENGGYADFHLTSVNLSDNSTVVVNDPGNPAGVVRVYLPDLPIQLQSATTVNGPYSLRTDAVFDSAAKTITVPVSPTAQFYRLTSSSVYPRITINKVVALGGGSVVIQYQ